VNNDLAVLQKQLKVTFHNRSILKQALVHSSYANENPDLTEGSNERLEFLGDAVLGLIIGEKLYHDFPEHDEGKLTRLRSVLVRRDTLFHIAKSVKLGDYLYLGKGEAASGGQIKPANLASAMEAVIAAVYLDGGLSVAAELVLRLFAGEIENIINHDATIDYKSRLQTILQGKYQQTPVYSTIKVKGPDHARQFTVEVKMGDKTLGKGSGHSKQTAEMEAARAALEKMKDDFTS
jgi:ribonuclease-3